MRKLSIAVLLALVLGALGTGFAAAQAMSDFGTVTLSAQNNSGQNGTASLRDMGNGTTMVELNITPGAAGVAQPAHIHEGTCANLNPAPEYPLTSVMNGSSTTTVNATIQHLLSRPHAINVHKSGPEAAVYVSCGDITAAAFAGASGPGMPRTGNGVEWLLLASLALLVCGMVGSGVLLRRRA